MTKSLWKGKRDELLHSTRVTISEQTKKSSKTLHTATATGCCRWRLCDQHICQCSAGMCQCSGSKTWVRVDRTWRTTPRRPIRTPVPRRRARVRPATCGSPTAAPLDCTHTKHKTPEQTKLREIIVVISRIWWMALKVGTWYTKSLVSGILYSEYT